jgi:hypothetical protein
MLRDGHGPRSGRDEARRGDELVHVSGEGYNYEPVRRERIECVCKLCGRNRPMLTGEGSHLAALFDALDAEPADSPGSVLPFDTAGWSGPTGGTAGPRLLDMSLLS